MLFKTFVVIAVAALTSGQRRYYSLEDMPDTNFDCRDKILGGYYADPEANCQMFHVCVKIPGQGVQDFRFLCPNETVFDQENQICADSGDIDCEASGLYLENFDLYRLGSAQAKLPQFNPNKGTAVPLGPSTKSPILTNNVYEDDDFYLQKSETGDRRSHSKDLLRGSSSSNFFNNRNKGKDLEDDDEEPAARRPDNNQFKARPNSPVRPKTQYQSQFRKVETPVSTSTQQPPIIDNQNQFNDKKRTKVAVRKLARKRPTEEAQTQSPQQAFSSFTTQVTQKFGFADQNSRYNTVNRTPTTPPTVATSEAFKQQPQQQQQQRFQNNFRRPEQQSTLAFFEPSPTAGTFPKSAEPKLEGNKDTAPFSLLRNPIVAAGANFQNQNRGSTNFQQNRPTTVAASNFPSPTPTGNQPFPTQQNFQQNQQNFQANRQTTPQANGFTQQRQNNGNFQQNRPQPTANSGNFQQNRQQAPANNGNFQQNRPQPQANNGNFQNQQSNGNFQNQQSNGNFQQNRQQAPANNGNFQQNRQQAPVNNGNFQNQQFNGNFQGRQQQQGNFQQQGSFQNQQQQGNFQQGRQQNNFQNQPSTNGNFQQTRQSTTQARQTTAALPVTRPQQPTYNAPNTFSGQQPRQTTPQQPPRQYFNRNYDEFDEGDNQEFLKTAPSNNFRPSDLNSFNNNYKDASNATKFAPTSTTKYYTPTIVTTPRTTPAPTTLRQNSFYSSPFPTTAPAPAPSASISTLPQRIYPSPTPAKTADAKDASYDYAYYDDAGAFSEYESLDTVGEPDFSRTSQRAKSRLI